MEWTILDNPGPFRPQPSPARPFGPGRQKPTSPGRPGGPGRVSRIARPGRFAVKRPLGISGAPILSARLACLGSRHVHLSSLARLRNRQTTHPNPPSGPLWSIPASGQFWSIPTPTEQPEPGAAVRLVAPETDFPGSPGRAGTCFTDRQLGSICCETTPWNPRGAHLERSTASLEIAPRASVIVGAT